MANSQANPQLGDGYTQIANEILDAFCRTFPSGANTRVLLAIIRHTYGWHKKEDRISISQIEDMTGLSRRAVIYALQNLEVQRFITVQRQRGRGNVNLVNTVALQENYDSWVVQRNSPQYEKQLQKQREKYQAGVVQRKDGGSAKNQQNVAENGSAKKEGSAKNGQGVVQRIDKNSQFFAPTKERKINNIYILIFNHWNQQNIISHKKLTDDVRSVIVRTLRSYSAEEIQTAISNYAEIIHGEQYFFKYKWTLKDFLKRGIGKFTDLEIAKSNFKEGKGGKAKDSRALPKFYTPTPDYPDL